jgi:hypothetical protein
MSGTSVVMKKAMVGVSGWRYGSQVSCASTGSAS